MNIDTFYEKAIQGGWHLSDKHTEQCCSGECPELDYGHIDMCAVLLDPEAWQAVGKADGSDPPVTAEDRKNGLTLRRNYVIRMHKFVDNLCDGKDLSASLNEATS